MTASQEHLSPANNMPFRNIHSSPLKTTRFHSRSPHLIKCNRTITIIPYSQLKHFHNLTLGLTASKTAQTRLRLSRRLDKAQRGNLGDVKPVGGRLYEMREHFGPGWRMYYTKRGDTLIVMLGGGGKKTQKSVIAKAQQRETTLAD